MTAASEFRERPHYARAVPDVAQLPPALAAAGSSLVFPRSEYWRVKSVSFTLVTVAGGGARQVVVSLDDSNGSSVFQVAAPGTQAGGLTVRYSFANGVNGFGSSALGAMGSTFVEGWLPDNMTLAVAVTGTSPTDAIRAGRVLVDRCPVRED